MLSNFSLPEEDLEFKVWCGTSATRAYIWCSKWGKPSQLGYIDFAKGAFVDDKGRLDKNGKFQQNWLAPHGLTIADIIAKMSGKAADTPRPASEPAAVATVPASRAERNALLKAAGFAWRRYDPENDDAYYRNREQGEWMLIGPDAREWSEEEALAVATGQHTAETLAAEKAAAKTAAADEVVGLVKFDNRDALTVSIVAEMLRAQGKRVVVRQEFYRNDSLKSGGYSYEALYLDPQDVEAAEARSASIYEVR